MGGHENNRVLINRRKLIRILLELGGERPYFELKQELDLASDLGKSKLVRAVCALANSSPNNTAYIVVGIENGTNRILGALPIDDQRFQQIIRTYLDPAPVILYENVATESGMNLGLLSIRRGSRAVRLAKDTGELKKGSFFVRCGSECLPAAEADIPSSSHYEGELRDVERRSAVRLEDTITDLLAFQGKVGPSYDPRVAVFNDMHVLCYSGWKMGGDLESEAWVELLGEGVSMFVSAVDYVKFIRNEKSFHLIHHQPLYWREKRHDLPLSETTFSFHEDGSYQRTEQIVFSPLRVPESEIGEVLAAYEVALKRYRDGAGIDGRMEIFPYELAVAHLIGSERAGEMLSTFMDGKADGCVAEGLSEAKRLIEFLRKENRKLIS